MEHGQKVKIMEKAQKINLVFQNNLNWFKDARGFENIRKWFKKNWFF